MVQEPVNQEESCMFRVSILVFTLLLSHCVFASPNSGKITNILLGPNYGNKVFIKISGSPTNAACHNNAGLHYVFDGTTASGEMTLSAILSAYMAEKDIIIKGTGACTLYAGIEDLANIYF